MSRNYDWEEGRDAGRRGYDRQSGQNEDYNRGYDSGVRYEREADQERRNRAAHDEEQAFLQDQQRQAEAQQEVVPCYKCKNQMYAEHWQNHPSENVCEECEDNDELPF